MSSAIVIAASPAHVWELITDAARWPVWCDICTQVDSVPEAWSPGNELAFKLRMAGVAVPFHVALNDILPERQVEWESTKLTITATRQISLQPTSDGVEVIDSKTFSSWLLPIRIAYPRFLIRSMTESWLADLKREAERNHT